MNFILCFTITAKQALINLKQHPALEKQYKAVKKTLEFLSQNPRHPSLQTHQYYSLQGPRGEKIFEAYAEQDTPKAYRVFFYYGPGKGEMTIFSITSHP